MAGTHTTFLVPEHALVRLTLGGFYEPDEALRLARHVGAAVAKLGRPRNQHVTLCDIRDMAIQSQGAVEAFMRVVATDGIRSRRLAFVVARSLARLQARRLTSRADVEFFDDIAPAEGWLGVAGGPHGEAFAPPPAPPGAV